MPDSEAIRAPRGVRGNYYNPDACRFRPVGGVGHWESVSGDSDIFEGTGELLVEAGVVTTDMLPGATSRSICWRPRGDSPREGEHWPHVPGYLRIDRLDLRGNLKVVVTRRRTPAPEPACTDAEADAATVAAGGIPRPSADEFRRACGVCVDTMENMLAFFEARGPVAFTADARLEVRAAIDDLRSLMAAAPLAPRLRLVSAGASK